MNNYEKIATNLIVRVLLDRKHHDIYDFHEKYRFSPLEILKSIRYLEDNKIIHIYNEKVVIRDDIDNNSVAILNFLSKTSKPERLSEIMLDI